MVKLFDVHHVIAWSVLWSGRVMEFYFFEKWWSGGMMIWTSKSRRYGLHDATYSYSLILHKGHILTYWNFIHHNTNIRCRSREKIVNIWFLYTKRFSPLHKTSCTQIPLHPKWAQSHNWVVFIWLQSIYTIWYSLNVSRRNTGFKSFGPNLFQNIFVRPSGWCAW